MKKKTLTPSFIKLACAVQGLLTVAVPTSGFVLATASAAGLMLATSENAEAQSVRMNNRQLARSVSRNSRQTVRQVTRTPGNAGQDIARNSRQATRQVSRNTYQSARQISRRHFYSLPSGYRWRTFGAYRYCYYGGRYYYPYMSGGRTVYIQVDVNSAGNPLPPPPASEVIVDVN